MSGHFDLRTAVASQLPWLTCDLGFQLIHSESNPRSFGDSLVVFQSGSMLVRFILERGGLFLELAPSGSNEWWDLTLLCGNSANTYPPSTPKESQLDDLEALFRQNFSQLDRALGPDLAETRLKIAKMRRPSEAQATPTAESTPLGRLSVRLLGWSVVLLIAWFILRSR